MAWGTVNVDEQRVRFVVSAKRGEKNMSALCEEFAISRPTGYQWLRRYRAEGIAGVVEKSRRPHQSPTQTASELEERVVELRQQRPDWGARKLQVLLADQGIHLPVITVHRILLRRGESVVADGFQKPAGMGRTGGTAVGAGRSQPLRDRAARNLVQQSSACKTAADRSVRALRRAARDADGSRDAVVEHESGGGLDVADGVDHASRHPAALQRVSPSADARESGAFSRSVERGDAATRNPGACGAANLAG